MFFMTCCHSYKHIGTKGKNDLFPSQSNTHTSILKTFGFGMSHAQGDEYEFAMAVITAVEERERKNGYVTQRLRFRNPLSNQ